MKCIEENSERLDLHLKSFSLEEKQKKRLLEINIQRKREIDTTNQMKLYDGTSTNSSILDQEDDIRKQLSESMNQCSTPALTPVVRVLNNVHGIYYYL